MLGSASDSAALLRVPTPTTPAPEPLLDREPELAAIAAACARARDGEGSVLGIEGPAGIGKTALIDAVRRAGEDAGFRVLTASGSELEPDLAFGVARQLFERLVHERRPEERGWLLNGAAALAGPVLLDPDPAPAAEAAHAAMHGLYWLAAELAARRPLMLVVDDAHWADAPSLRWLAYLGRRLDGVPLLAVVAWRDSEPGVHGVAGMPPGRPAAVSTLVRPRPLGEASIAAWLDRSFGRPAAPELVRACAVASGGNPFLLRELATSLARTGVEPDAGSAAAVSGIAPASIARAVLGRLARLGDEAVAVAEAAATLANDARLDRVAALAGVPVPRAAELADELAAAGILDPGEPLTFRHPILRSSVHEQTPACRRGLAHLAAARLLLDGGLGPERAASHLLAAPAAARGWVTETLRAAAASALGRGAPEASVALLRRALAEGDGGRAETLTELSVAEFTVQDPVAVDHAIAAMAAATTPSLRARAGLAAARALTPVGRYDEALAILDAVERETEGLDAASRQAVRAEALVLTSWHTGVAALAGPLEALGVDELPGVAPADRLLIALRAMEAVSRGRSTTETLGLARRVMEHAAADDPRDESAVLMAARVMVLCDAVDEAEPVLSAVLDGGRARGAVATVATAAALRAEARARVGRLAEAESDAREALDIATEHGLGVVVPVVVGVLVELLLDRAPATEAVELVARFANVRVPAGYPESAMRYARGRAAAAAGDVELAVGELAACRAGQREWGEVNPARYPSRTQLALALTGAGRADEAPALADEEVELARRFGAARAVGIALRGRALLARGEARIEGLREAASVLGASPARLEQARTLLELGAALRRSGQRVEARSVLSAALDGCHACGAHVLADRARAELRAAGARPRRERLSGVEALTAGELRVAELAARGLTNRQIAQTLFVTSKTVETHLSHVYPKLGIAGRSELGEKLQGASPDAPEPAPVGRSVPFLDQGRTGGEGEVDLYDAVRLRRSGSGRG